MTVPVELTEPDPYHAPVRIGWQVWVVLIVAAVAGVVAATLTFASDKQRDAADKTDVANLKANQAAIATSQDCVVALLLVPPQQRSELSDEQVRAVCPESGLTAAETLAAVSASSTAPATTAGTSPSTTVAPVRRVPSRSTTTIVRSSPTTTAQGAPTTTTQPSPSTTTTTTAPPCSTVPVVGRCLP